MRKNRSYYYIRNEITEVDSTKVYMTTVKAILKSYKCNHNSIMETLAMGLRWRYYQWRTQKHFNDSPRLAVASRKAWEVKQVLLLAFVSTSHSSLENVTLFDCMSFSTLLTRSPGHTCRSFDALQ